MSSISIIKNFSNSNFSFIDNENDKEKKYCPDLNPNCLVPSVKNLVANNSDSSELEDSDSSELDESQETLEEISDLEKLERSLGLDTIEELSEIASNAFYFTPNVDLDGKTNPNNRFPDTVQVLSEITSNGLHLLDGTLNAHLIPENASELLRKNINTAKKINYLVNKLIPFSYNFLQRSRIFALNSPYTHDSILSLKSVVRKSIKHLRETISLDYSLDYNIDILGCNVSKILKHKTGNCGEMSRVGYYLGVTGYPSLGLESNAPIEWVKLAGIDEKTEADHYFLIIGRNQEIPLSDYKSWAVDPAVVIGDPWTRSEYPAVSGIDQYLMDFIGIKVFNNEWFTVVKKFDPSIYTIKSAREKPKNNAKAPQVSPEFDT